MYSLVNNFPNIFSNIFFADGHSEVEVTLLAKKYVEKGGSVTLFCDHNVSPDILYKVNRFVCRKKSIISILIKPYARLMFSLLCTPIV